MLTIEEIRNTVEKIAPKYKIKKVTLFGSRATKNYRENSDVDLIVEFETKIISLFKLAGLMNELEEKFGVGVDIIHGPLEKDSMLEIKKEITIYAA
ncbi:MAG: nucleotidyltransferase domain-containing protein [Quinella sp. 3Q1]|nr:nucleotidyltransferase domain-containing protein [Quinella sp. 3Q1]MBR6889055.1 nucleotidyltransferase domain-containing protein [Selenomonadaceae bacterium]